MGGLGLSVGVLVLEVGDDVGILLVPQPLVLVDEDVAVMDPLRRHPLGDRRRHLTLDRHGLHPTDPPPARPADRRRDLRPATRLAPCPSPRPSVTSPRRCAAPPPGSGWRRRCWAGRSRSEERRVGAEWAYAGART